MIRNDTMPTNVVIATVVIATIWLSSPESERAKIL
jgi:hypothetical protein